MRYFIRSEEGPERGPYAWYQIKQMLRSEDLAGDDLVREEDNPTWRALREVEAERTAQQVRRDREEMDHASRKRQKATPTIVVGVAFLILGVGLMLGSSLLPVERPIIFVPWGLIVVGIVQIGRGFDARRRL
jgi:hypothetical protein